MRTDLRYFRLKALLQEVHLTDTFFARSEKTKKQKNELRKEGAEIFYEILKSNPKIRRALSENACHRLALSEKKTENWKLLIR